MLLNLKSMAFVSLLLIGVGCTHTEPSPEVESLPGKKDPSADKDKQEEAEDKLPVVIKEEPKSEPCLPPAEQGLQVPVFLEQTGIMVTQILNECVTKTSEGQIQEEVKVLAMGFPCSGGRGEVDVTGYPSSPKMVAFNISNSCPMSPMGQHEAKAKIDAEGNLGGATSLLAYFPMSIQYWELEGFPEADVGSVVELRSDVGLNQAWKTFQKGQPLKLKVFGRENAWLNLYHMYQADIELVKQSETTFKIKVVGMKMLNEEELGQAQRRCLTSLSSNTCGEVFGG
jgi:hypothetical protein